MASDGDWHSRQEILSVGEKKGLKRDILDRARKTLLEANQVVAEQQGKEVGIRLQERSDAPVLLKDRTERSELAGNQTAWWVPE